MFSLEKGKSTPPQKKCQTVVLGLESTAVVAIWELGQQREDSLPFSLFFSLSLSLLFVTLFFR